MAATLKVAGILGWKISADGQSVVGVTDANAGEIELQFDQTTLWKMTVALIDASGAFPLPDAIDSKLFSMTPSMIAMAGTDLPEHVIVGFHRDGGGRIYFHLEREAAQALSHELLRIVAEGATPQRKH